MSYIFRGIASDVQPLSSSASVVLKAGEKDHPCSAITPLPIGTAIFQSVMQMCAGLSLTFKRHTENSMASGSFPVLLRGP